MLIHGLLTKKMSEEFVNGSNHRWMMKLQVRFGPIFLTGHVSMLGEGGVV